ncbi:MAG: cation:proton antiporter [Deltaproteobacteria bacterium]|jgi:Kef-type K+ transport system membrane component KefB|nr:cation:proton antiporter [Deltaproteobacteria bacterium]
MDNLLQEIITIKNLLITSPLLVIGLLLVFGFFLGKIAEKFKLPNISGYILAGLLLGNSVTGIVSVKMAHSLQLVTELALSIIAMTIGGEFFLAKLKQMGKAVIIMTISQLLLSFILVTIALLLLGMELPFALLLGAISTATAPAATVAIVQSLRIKGKFIDYLYSIVALDDAGAVILYGIVFAVSAILLGVTSVDAGPMMSIIHAFLDVVLSISLGLVSGVFIHYSVKKLRSKNEVLVITLGILILTTALANIFKLSPLLTNMAGGAILINLSSKNHRVFHSLEKLSPPIFALFFIIAGTELKPDIIFQTSILLTGMVYVIARIVGKYGGIYLAGRLVKAEPRISKYLGLCMMPQAGVALGLVLLIQASPISQALPASQQAILINMVNIVLFSIFINELVGPPVSKFGIIKGCNLEE